VTDEANRAAMAGCLLVAWPSQPCRPDSCRFDRTVNTPEPSVDERLSISNTSTGWRTDSWGRSGCPVLAPPFRQHHKMFGGANHLVDADKLLDAVDHMLTAREIRGW